MKAHCHLAHVSPLESIMWHRSSPLVSSYGDRGDVVVRVHVHLHWYICNNSLRKLLCNFTNLFSASQACECVCVFLLNKAE